MMLFPQRPPAPHAYHLVARVIGQALPSIDKLLRLRCTLHAADHSTVGTSSVVVHLGTALDCDRQLELVHEPAAAGAAPPKYFELVASLAPSAEPAARLRGAFAANSWSDGTEYRVAGLMDPALSRIRLPAIALRGLAPA